jgi:hypothetical protein
MFIQSIMHTSHSIIVIYISIQDHTADHIHAQHRQYPQSHRCLTTKARSVVTRNISTPLNDRLTDVTDYN